MAEIRHESFIPGPGQGERSLPLEVLDGQLVRSDAVFAVQYVPNGRVYRRAFVGRLFDNRLRSKDFPPFRDYQPTLLGWAARPDLGPAFAEGFETDADPLNDDPDYARAAAARAVDAAALDALRAAESETERAAREADEARELRVARARAALADWSEERRLTGDSPLARNGYERAYAELREAQGALEAAHSTGGLGAAMESLGLAEPATSPKGAKRFRVVIHTSYEEVYEVAYDGDAEDLLDDDEASRGVWTRVSSRDVGELEECGAQVQSAEEISR